MKVYQEYYKLFRLTCGLMWKWKDKAVYYNLLHILSKYKIPSTKVTSSSDIYWYIWLMKYHIFYFVSKLFQAIIMIWLIYSFFNNCLCPKQLLSNKNLRDPELFEHFANMKGIMLCLVQSLSWHCPLVHTVSLPHEERKVYAEKVHSSWYQNLYNNVL